MKLDLSKKNHVDCFKLMTGNYNKGIFVREKCPKCGNMKNQATGRKIYCRRSNNTIEIKNEER
jgi:hypothetical protein